MWIKVDQNQALRPPQTSRITITTLPSLSAVTANQLFCFDDDNNDEAYADSQAIIHIVKDEVNLNNEVTTSNGPSVISTIKNIIKAKAREKLCLPNLPTKANIAHKMSVAQNLFLLAV